MITSPETNFNQEYQRETRLSVEVVHNLYNSVIMTDNGYGERIYVQDHVNHDEVFNKEKLEAHRGEIERLAAQLQPRFFNKDTGGADYKDARFDQYQECWDKDKNSIEHKHLLAMIKAIDLGKVTTSRFILERGPMKLRRVTRFLIDPEPYQKEINRQEKINGKPKHNVFLGLFQKNTQK